MLALAVFGCLAAWILYVLAGYPCLLAWRARCGKPIRRAPFEPSVSVLLAVHNGAAHR